MALPEPPGRQEARAGQDPPVLRVMPVPPGQKARREAQVQAVWMDQKVPPELPARQVPPEQRADPARPD